MDGPDDEQAPARGRLHPLHVPRRNDRAAGAGWHPGHDSGDRAVDVDQCSDTAAVCAARKLRLSRSGHGESELRQPEQLACLGVYVTGSHEMKVGYQGSYIRVKNWFLVNEQQLAYRFNRGTPNQVTFRLPEWHQSDRTATGSLYVQDKWTRGRLTLQGALRYDRAWSFTPADHNGTELTSRFNAAPISFPRTPGVDSFNDITPRFGAAYDVFGNGRTALKFNLGHYLDSATNDSE